MSYQEGSADLRILLFKECHYKKPFGHAYTKWEVINQPGIPVAASDLDGYGFLVPDDAPQDVIDHVRQRLEYGPLFGDQLNEKWVIRGVLRDSDVRKLRSKSDTRYEDVVVARSSKSDAMTDLDLSTTELPKKTRLPPPPKYDESQKVTQ